MEIEVIATYTASDLKKSGPILDTAARGAVRINRRNESFLLLRQEELEALLANAADPRPKTLAQALEGYDAEDVKRRLCGWFDDASSGTEVL